VKRRHKKNPSGVAGPLGRLADAWDRIPVKGPMVGLVSALGLGFALTAGPGGTCEDDPLAHVYRPSRLQVVEKCAEVTGTVVAYRREHDGDFHVSMIKDGWTNAVNDKKQHGFTVVEFVPLMERPKFYVGQRLKLVGTKILDRQHGGWIELHPVFEVKDVTPARVRPGVNRPSLAPPTEEEGKR
jgi:hypothetical protein